MSVTGKAGNPESILSKFLDARLPQRRLVAQLDESYSEAATAHDELQSLEQSVQTASESLRLTRLRYSAGEATVLEVVDAENSLTTAEMAREDGTVRYQLALKNLQLLTGAI